MNNRITPSKSFYLNKLKNSSKNLNKSPQELDLLEEKLEIFLKFTYRWLHPLFNDEHEKMNHYQNSFQDDIDDDFDNEVVTQLPKWLIAIISFFEKFYNKLFKNKLIKFCVKRLKKIVIIKFSKYTPSILFKIISFFRFKSPP